VEQTTGAKLALSRHPRAVFTSVFTRQQAIDSLIKKSGSKDSTSFLLLHPRHNSDLHRLCLSFRLFTGTFGGYEGHTLSER
jgi:hypothetical protein